MKRDDALGLRYAPPHHGDVCSWCGAPLADRPSVAYDERNGTNGGSLTFCSARCSAARHTHLTTRTEATA